MNEPIFEIKEEDKKSDYSKFVISPLEQGYGHTLGNSLRRVLMTSLTGAAVTTVKIAGVKHQFSTLKGMKEDIVEFVLNLKKIRFKIEGSNESVKIKLSVNGPGEVKAKDIKTPANVTIANEELVLAYLNKGAKLNAEMQIEKGVGYSPSEERGERKIGYIPVDATFTPVTRVNYKVEETRVGRVTNYDKLILEVWTDGTIIPKEALLQASRILISYFGQIVKPKKRKKVKEEEADTLGPVGNLSVEEINLPTRVANALIKARYETVEDLSKAKKEDLVKVRNLGEKSIKVIKAALTEKDVEFLVE